MCTRVCLLKTPTIAGTTAEAVVGTLAGVYKSVSLCTYFVTETVSQPYKIQAQNWCVAEIKLTLTGVIP